MLVHEEHVYNSSSFPMLSQATQILFLQIGELCSVNYGVAVASKVWEVSGTEPRERFADALAFVGVSASQVSIQGLRGCSLEQVIFTYAALTPGTPHGSVAWMPVVTLSVCHPKAPSRSVKRSALSGTRSLSFELLPLRKSMFTLMDNVLSSPKCSPGNHIAKQITKQWVLIFPIMLASVLCW